MAAFQTWDQALKPVFKSRSEKDASFSVQRKIRKKDQKEKFPFWPFLYNAQSTGNLCFLSFP